MKFTALAVLLMLSSVVLGARGTGQRAWVAPCLALAIITAQFALVMFE
jgi:hypothetical protein